MSHFTSHYPERKKLVKALVKSQFTTYAINQAKLKRYIETL